MAQVVLDEDVQKSLAQRLRDAGHTVERVVEVGLAGAPDEAVFNHAQQRGAVVITKDTGFVDATALPPNHGGVLLLRFPNTVKAEQVNQEVMRFLADQISLDDMRGRVAVLKPRGRARLRGPEQ
jgi:predicted nuclease of predicted toxin-antitoxin system